MRTAVDEGTQMIRLTQFAIRERSVVLLLAAGVFLAGLFAWGQLRQELLPDVDLPIVTVISALPGAGAEDVAAQVTEPVERALANIPRLEQLQSTSANSLSLVVAQFSFGTDVKETLASIDQQLAGVTLPQGVAPRVASFDFNDQPVVIAALRPVEGADVAEAFRLAREVVRPAIASLEGVSSADVSGGASEVIRISLEPAKLAEAGIPLTQVAGVIQANQVTIPSGTLTEGELRLPVSTEHRFASVDELGSLVVGYRNLPGSPGAAAGGLPAPVALADLGTVAVEEVRASGYARTDGAPSLTLAVGKGGGANTVLVADAVRAELARIAALYPETLAYEVISDLSVYIKESRDGLVKEGLLGAFFAILTILVFLGSLRSTLVAAVSIPLSILAALAAMGATGLTINILTLGGLAVAVGRVVDDSIVVLENIYRHRARGEEVTQAVLEGTREVASAITSSTVTTVAVFLPIGFVGGIVSQFFLPIGITVTLALLASLIVALTVIPVLAWFFVRKVDVKVDPDGELHETIWQRLYTPVLLLALRRRATKWGTLGIAFALFIATNALVPLLPTSFISAGGEKLLSVTISPPNGASGETVLARTEAAEAILGADALVELVQSTIPGDADTGAQTLQAAFSGKAANSARMTVRLADEADLAAKLEEFLAALAPVATDGFEVSVEQAGGFAVGGFAVVISGPDPAAIRVASDALVPALAAIDGLENVTSDLAAAAPQVTVTVDPSRAIAAGLTAAQVGGEIRNALVGQQLGTITPADGSAIPVILRLDTGAAGGIEGLRNLPMGTGPLASTLGAIADVRETNAQSSVTRVDGAPAATIGATLTSDDQGGISRAAQLAIDGLVADGAIPAGVDVRLAGVTEQQGEAFGGLFLSMLVAILVVYVVMVLVFGSLIDPFVILFSLPLATIGAFPALLITGRPIGISALIGFLMLIGIVVTNAIVLLDLVEQLRHKGMSTHDALVQGGRTRVRPILMTAVATILALMPVALGLSEGSIIAAELGTVVIGGLLSSTMLTLIVIPVIYSLVDGGKSSMRRRFGGRLASTAAVEPSAVTQG
ncbi:MAG: efflux RND transporter permease subunit [Chloroflexota bacterium]